MRHHSERKHYITGLLPTYREGAMGVQGLASWLPHLDSWQGPQPGPSRFAPTLQRQVMQ